MLSRNNTASFLLKVPRAKREPDVPSVQLLKLLLDPKVDWVSSRWSQLFRDISRISLPPPNAHMSRR